MLIKNIIPTDKASCLLKVHKNCLKRYNLNKDQWQSGSLPQLFLHGVNNVAPLIETINNEL